METLIKRIFEITGVTYEEMCSSVKNPSFNHARILFCHEMRFKHGLTCREIGLKIGRKKSIVGRFTNRKIDQDTLDKLRATF